MTTETVTRERRRIAKERSAYSQIDALIAKTGLELTGPEYQSLRAVLFRWATFDTQNGWEKLRKAIGDAS